jgi:hypothetical protein
MVGAQGAQKRGSGGYENDLMRADRSTAREPGEDRRRCYATGSQMRVLDESSAGILSGGSGFAKW